MLELSEEEPMSPEHLDSQVQKAQDQLLQLRRQQDQIEKQKRELEELSRKQEELERGRAEMADKLTRSLVVLEREAYDAQKRLEQLRSTRESFGQHLELIEAIDPKSWNPSDLHKELSRAFSTVEGARAEFVQQRSRLQAGSENNGEAPLSEAEPVFSTRGPFFSGMDEDRLRFQHSIYRLRIYRALTFFSGWRHIIVEAACFVARLDRQRRSIKPRKIWLGRNPNCATKCKNLSR